VNKINELLRVIETTISRFCISTALARIRKYTSRKAAVRHFSQAISYIVLSYIQIQIRDPVARPVQASIGVIVITSRRSHSPVKRRRSVISGCRVTRTERSHSACHSCTFSRSISYSALRLTCSLFIAYSLIIIHV